MKEETRRLVVGILLGLLLGSSLRAFLSTAFGLSLATLRLNGTAFWLLVLLAPALAPLVPRTRWVAVGAAVGVAVLPLARFTPLYAPVAAGAVAVGLLALAQFDRRGVLGVVPGLALNGALLVADASHDLLVRPVGIAVGLACAVGLAVLRPRDRDDAPASLAGGVAWGALLLLQVAFLSSPYAVARWFGVPAWTVAAATLLGLAGGLALAGRVRGRLVGVVGAVALVDVAVVGPTALLSLAALQAALAAATLRLPRPHGVTLALAFAPAAFGILYFGQVMGRAEWALSVPLLALPALAALAFREGAPLSFPRRAAAGLALGLLALPPGLLAAPVEPHAGPAEELVVVAWNVHQGFGNRGGLDPEAYVRVVRELRPDVLILTEADTARLSSGGLDVVDHLSREAGLHAHARGTGIALLSRFPLAEGQEDAVRLGWTSHVALDVHGETVHVQGVHLARSREERARQVQNILALANSTEGPRILGGDLNSCAAEVCFGGRPSDRVHDALAVAYRDAWTVHHDGTDPAGHTHPAWDPRRRIDVVLVRDLDVVAASPVRTADTAAASDHLPVLARLRLRS